MLSVSPWMSIGSNHLVQPTHLADQQPFIEAKLRLSPENFLLRPSKKGVL
jgi:hypothetical protein